MPKKHALEDSVRAKYSELALCPDAPRSFGTGPSSAKTLGYPAAWIDALPTAAVESFAGVGHPLAIEEPRLGETILDLGCGAGLDVLFASRGVGPDGLVVGVDFSGPMLAKARGAAAEAGVRNVRFVQACVDALPFGSEIFDRVVSNGVLNLCVDKAGTMREAYRALRPGGRLQMTDIVLEEAAAPQANPDVGEWSA